ncbi:hypothetical protein MKW92_037040, partial [Papaver armeniacum]
MSDENIGHMIQDQLEDGTLTDGATVNMLLELTNCTEEGSSQLADFVKKWEYQQYNTTHLVHEELDIQELKLLETQEVEVAKDEAIKKEKQLFVQEEMVVAKAKKTQPNET